MWFPHIIIIMSGYKNKWFFVLNNNDPKMFLLMGKILIYSLIFLISPIFFYIIPIKERTALPCHHSNTNPQGKIGLLLDAEWYTQQVMGRNTGYIQLSSTLSYLRTALPFNSRDSSQLTQSFLGRLAVWRNVLPWPLDTSAKFWGVNITWIWL